MIYLALKHLHVSCVALSGAGFFLRGVLMLRDSPWPKSVRVRRLADTVDSMLLASALVLAFLSDQYPLKDAWLTAKVLGLMAYIGLGMAAFRLPARTARAGAWLAALAVFGYIVSVALTKNAVGFFAAP